MKHVKVFLEMMEDEEKLETILECNHNKFCDLISSIARCQHAIERHVQHFSAFIVGPPNLVAFGLTLGIFVVTSEQKEALLNTYEELIQLQSEVLAVWQPRLDATIQAELVKISTELQMYLKNF